MELQPPIESASRRDYVDVRKEIKYRLTLKRRGHRPRQDQWRLKEWC